VVSPAQGFVFAGQDIAEEGGKTRMPRMGIELTIPEFE
jgi:hypothetical protein